MRGRRPGDGHDRGARVLRRSAWLAVGLAAVCLPAACGSSSNGPGIALRRLQDAALLAEKDRTRCPLDLDFPKAVGGDVQPATGDGAATGTSVGKGAAGGRLLAVGGASYRCGYSAAGKPVSLVVVAVPRGQAPAAAAEALTSPLQEAGLDQAAAQGLADAVKAAKPGKGVPAPGASAAGASSTLPGGGAAAVAIVGDPGGAAPTELAKTAARLAATLKG